MNSIGRVILILISGTLALCLCLTAAGYLAVRSAGWIMARSFETDSATVAEVGGNIADYELPSGFSDAYAADLAGFSMVSFTNADRHSHIYLFQAPASLAMEQVDMEKQLRQGAGHEDWANVTEVERRTCEIRGEQTTMVVSEGFNHENVPYRTASALFAGKDGTALVNISMPSASWDQTMVDEFIASLR
jgi:hypothetical protein